MTVMTSLAEFARDPRKHIELVNGEIIVSPNAATRHYRAMFALYTVLNEHGLNAEVEANLILDEQDPLRPLVREPDVYVTRKRIDGDSVFQHAQDTILVAEIVSPGSGITDWVEKMSEYADAGIPHYWILDSYIDRSLHLYTFNLKGGGYGDREHWAKEVDITVAGVRVQFDVRDLLKAPTGR